jgi:hypothetical protein
LPRIEKDSIAVGVRYSSPCSGALRRSCEELRGALSAEPMIERVAVDDLSDVDVLRFDSSRTVLLGVGVLLALPVWYLAALSQL